MVAERIAAVPQSIFTPHGAAAATLSRLGIALTVTAVIVTVLVTVLILVALRRRAAAPEPGTIALSQYIPTDRRGTRWIVIGSVITFCVLAVAAAYSVKVLVAYPGELASASLTVRITGFQYWWNIEYIGADGRPAIVDANELHIPAGTRVRLELAAADVIHSFWVPGLGGKTDLIPGQRTTMWIEADEPGVFRGQCAEFCGMSHANMQLRVVALSAADLRGVAIRRAHAAITRQCRGPHCAGSWVRGVSPFRRANVGHRRSRPDALRTACDAQFRRAENTADNLRAWLADPQAIKPGALMPRAGLTHDEIEQLVAYLGARR